jgi:hypothetical protein
VVAGAGALDGPLLVEVPVMNHAAEQRRAGLAAEQARPAAKPSVTV